MMRVLKNDFSRYMEVEEDEIGGGRNRLEIDQWRCFSISPFANGLTALLGAGAISCVLPCCLICAISNCIVPTKRGAILTAMIILYACTAPIGGFVSARLYCQIGGKAWLSNALVTATVFPIPLVLVLHGLIQ